MRARMALVALLLIAACRHETVPRTSATSVSPAPTTTALTCGRATLTLRIDFGPEAGTGRTNNTLVAHNNGPFSCSLSGYPDIQFLDGIRELAFPITHDGGHTDLGSPQPTTLTLRVGDEALSAFGRYRCDGPSETVATAIRVSLGTGASAHVQLPHAFGYCDDTEPGHPMVITALVQGFEDLRPH
jgi:hypothetical protein